MRSIQSFIFFNLLLISLYPLNSANNFRFQPKKKVKTKKAKGDVGIKKLTNQLDGSFGYDRDDTNFWSPNNEGAAKQGEIPSLKKITTKPIVLVNSHGTDELYLGPSVSGQFVPGKHRSLNWGCSLEEADTMIKNQMAIHDNLALPLVWSGNKYRSHVTFTIIPEGTEIEFKKGSAATQMVGDDIRPGGGQQIRMKYIPKNAITITKPFLGDNKASLAQEKGAKSFNLRALLEEGINEYNTLYPNEKMNAKQVAYESYYSRNFEESLQDPEDFKANEAKAKEQISLNLAKSLKEETMLNQERKNKEKESIQEDRPRTERMIRE